MHREQNEQSIVTGYLEKMNSELKIYSNLPCILDKISNEGILDALAFQFEEILSKEMIYAVSVQYLKKILRSFVQHQVLQKVDQVWKEKVKSKKIQETIQNSLQQTYQGEFSEIKELDDEYLLTSNLLSFNKTDRFNDSKTKNISKGNQQQSKLSNQINLLTESSQEQQSDQNLNEEQQRQFDIFNCDKSFPQRSKSLEIDPSSIKKLVDKSKVVKNPLKQNFKRKKNQIKNTSLKVNKKKNNLKNNKILKISQNQFFHQTQNSYFKQNKNISIDQIIKTQKNFNKKPLKNSNKNEQSLKENNPLKHNKISHYKKNTKKFRRQLTKEKLLYFK